MGVISIQDAADIRRRALQEVLDELQRLDNWAYDNAGHPTWDPELGIGHAIEAVAKMVKAADAS